MKKIFVFMFGLNIAVVLSQTNNPLDFWPHHKGDVWQYRSQATNNLINTYYIDSILVDSISKDRFLFERFVRGDIIYTHSRIDSIGNFYNRDIDSLGEIGINYNKKLNTEYIRYKLYADSGDQWINGYEYDSIPVTVSLLEVYSAVIYNVPTTVKVYRFEIQNPPPQNPFWIGNDHLAEGFGLIKTEVEPSEVYYLSGAIINGVKYGTITSIEDEKEQPEKFNLITNYPNPFNNSTVISYRITVSRIINITIYDLLGREIEVLINEEKEKGFYEIKYEAKNISSGTYFIVLRTGNNILTHKIGLM